MNLPNSLTLIRIFLIPLLVVVLLTRFPSKEFIGVAIFLAAAFTDWLDGRVARKRGQVTALGVWLDPLADKLLIAAALLALVELRLAPAWMVLIILGRELAVTGLRNIALLQGFSIAVSDLGKVKMGVQVFSVVSLLLGVHYRILGVLGGWALWVVVVFALLSAVQYLREFWIQAGLPVKTRPMRHPLSKLWKQQKTDVPTQR
ncbi:MAG: CDP-diacylglycerol--glycerol-3-phosphate 3-phosphatidyltransferase [Acidobacteria bacterium]|nr:CDP-diacylglycerol--glycerol-3-phosphate 3-phosphatidyltransferase [Acidobacteriota bacterium]